MEAEKIQKSKTKLTSIRQISYRDDYEIKPQRVLPSLVNHVNNTRSGNRDEYVRIIRGSEWEHKQRDEVTESERSGQVILRWL
ncbi:hypothetical protein ACTXT7_009372 [Hymenolepis weldensis]